MRDIPNLTEINNKLTNHELRLKSLEENDTIPPEIAPPIITPNNFLIGMNDGWWHKSWDPSNPGSNKNILHSHLKYRKPISKSGIRFMDTLRCNDLGIITFEHIENTLKKSILLCNRLNVDFYYNSHWIMPQIEVEKCLNLIDETLHPDLKIWGEPANEIWNASQNPYKWIKEMFGVDLGHDKFFEEWARVANNLYNAMDKVLPSTRKSKKVLAGQTANPWVIRQVHKRITYPIDAMAQTTYYRQGDWYSGISDNEFLTNCETRFLPEMKMVLKHLKQTTEVFKLKPISYESNHHWIIDGNVQAMKQVNRLLDHPRSLKMLKRSLTTWFDNGGEEAFIYRALGLNDSHHSWSLSQDANVITDRYNLIANFGN